MLDRETHFPAPVRILPRGPRKILLIGFSRDVFLVNGPQDGGREREKTGDGMVQLGGQRGILRRGAGKVLRQEACAEQGIEQFLFILRARGGLGAETLFVNGAGRAASFDIGVRPVAGERRQVQPPQYVVDRPGRN